MVEYPNYIPMNINGGLIEAAPIIDNKTEASPQQTGFSVRDVQQLLATALEPLATLDRDK